MTGAGFDGSLLMVGWVPFTQSRIVWSEEMRDFLSTDSWSWSHVRNCGLDAMAWRSEFKKQEFPKFIKPDTCPRLCLSDRKKIDIIRNYFLVAISPEFWLWSWPEHECCGTNSCSSSHHGYKQIVLIDRKKLRRKKNKKILFVIKTQNFLIIDSNPGFPTPWWHDLTHNKLFWFHCDQLNP